MDVKEELILKHEIGDHWYYSSKLKALLHMLGAQQYGTVIDIGAGSGFFSKRLLETSIVEDAWCIDTSYEEDRDTTANDKPLFFRKAFTRTSANLFLFMDVLEHVEDDVALLRSYVDDAEVGATFLISVPAFQFLWSDHDEFLEHKRRYTLKEIERVAKQAGLNVKNGSYFYASVFPIATASRLYKKLFRRASSNHRSQLRHHNRLTNSLLGLLTQLDFLVFPHNRWVGLTAFCLAVKEKEQDPYWSIK